MAYKTEVREANPLQIQSIDPNDEHILGTVTAGTQTDVDAAVARAHAAQPGWAALSLKERSRYLRRVQETIVEHADELAEIVSAESGKILTEAIIGDVLLTLTSLTGYLKLAPRVLKKRRMQQGLLHSTKRSYVVQEPHGVVAVISPYNFPILLSMQSAFAALIAGNAVINKPSEHTPLSALKMKDIFDRAGMPPDVFQVMLGYGETGQMLAEATGVNKISFVGSPQHGRNVAHAAAEKLIPVTLELGGVNSMIVLDDAQLERAAYGAISWSCLTSGQACGSIARVYVYESILEPFSQRVKEIARDVNIGPQRNASFHMASLINEHLRQRITSMVDDAVAQGAQLLLERSPNGSGPPIYHPTVLTNVRQDMIVMQEETFGPVMSIIPISSDEEAVRLANDSKYGLTASVWTRDKKRAWNVARQLQVGSVAVNDHLWDFFAPEVPWGGVKNSGIGRVGGEWGLLAMTEPKVISYDRLNLKREFYWIPSPLWVGEFFRHAIPLLYSRKLGRKLKGLVNVLRSIGKDEQT